LGPLYIEFSSPGGAEVKIDFGVAEILKVLLEAFRNLGLYRKRYQEETRHIAIENDRKKLENEGIKLEHERKELENANYKIEVIRNAINVASEAQTKMINDEVTRSLLSDPLKRALNVKEIPKDLFRENSLEQGILENRVIPAALELLNGDDPHYELDVSAEEPAIAEEKTGSIHHEKY
jgi:hypothetical protein